MPYKVWTLKYHLKEEKGSGRWTIFPEMAMMPRLPTTARMVRVTREAD